MEEHETATALLLLLREVFSLNKAYCESLASY